MLEGKEANEWKDLYGRERKGFYERNGGQRILSE